jgi:hypothetical protein
MVQQIRQLNSGVTSDLKPPYVTEKMVPNATDGGLLMPAHFMQKNWAFF